MDGPVMCVEVEEGEGDEDDWNENPKCYANLCTG